ncbi:MAG: thermonuclease family protein [Treponema sp.]|jgi:micrococcal nuclease|nr:thermonuclease family protein [Treponema sp.]
MLYQQERAIALKKVKRSLVLISLAILSILWRLPLLKAEDTKVYVTNSGTKYHRETCSFLSRSKIAVSLNDVLISGYEPCGVCKPPLPSQDKASARASVPQTSLYRINTTSLTKSSMGDISRMLPAEVVGHVDGDTVRVRISNPPAELKAIETIRMLGVDTPETVHPSKPVERFGKEASDFTKAALLGTQVYLAFDWDLRDHYGRLLAYLYTPESRCFNALLIEEGYAYAYVSYPFHFMEEFKGLEQAARQDKRGLWRNL